MRAREQAAAGMEGRGATSKQIADTFGVNQRTVERWGELWPDGRERVPGFRAEVERVREQSVNPTAEGTLLDALSAHKTDNINWQARIAAAIELRKTEMGAHAVLATHHVTLNVFRDTDGQPDDVIDVEPEEIPPKRIPPSFGMPDGAGTP